MITRLVSPMGVSRSLNTTPFFVHNLSRTHARIARERSQFQLVRAHRSHRHRHVRGAHFIRGPFVNRHPLRITTPKESIARHSGKSLTDYLAQEKIRRQFYVVEELRRQSERNQFNGDSNFLVSAELYAQAFKLGQIRAKQTAAAGGFTVFASGTKATGTTASSQTKPDKRNPLEDHRLTREWSFLTRTRDSLQRWAEQIGAKHDSLARRFAISRFQDEAWSHRSIAVAHSPLDPSLRLLRDQYASLIMASEATVRGMEENPEFMPVLSRNIVSVGGIVLSAIQTANGALKLRGMLGPGNESPKMNETAQLLGVIKGELEKLQRYIAVRIEALEPLRPPSAKRAPAELFLPHDWNKLNRAQKIRYAQRKIKDAETSLRLIVFVPGNDNVVSARSPEAEKLSFWNDRFNELKDATVTGSLRKGVSHAIRAFRSELSMWQIEVNRNLERGYALEASTVTVFDFREARMLEKLREVITLMGDAKLTDSLMEIAMSTHKNLCDWGMQWQVRDFPTPDFKSKRLAAIRAFVKLLQDIVYEPPSE